MEVKNMNEQERAAYYKSEIDRAKAQGLGPASGAGFMQTAIPAPPTPIPGSGMVQSGDTARYNHANGERQALANALTMEEKIIATSKGRQAAYHKASILGVRADENVVHRAGVLAVQEAAKAKVAAAKADQK